MTPSRSELLRDIASAIIESGYAVMPKRKNAKRITRLDRQQDILNFIAYYTAHNGYPPTYQEMADACGMKTKSHVDAVLCQLEDAGKIMRRPGKARSVVIRIG